MRHDEMKAEARSSQSTHRRAAGRLTPLARMREKDNGMMAAKGKLFRKSRHGVYCLK
jgi:hypothetical protein